MKGLTDRARIKVIVNQREVEVYAGLTILQAVREIVKTCGSACHAA